MRLALITPYLPAPANTGGRIRIARLARALASEFEVSLYACGGAREARRARGGPALRLYGDVHVRNSDHGVVPPVVTSHRVRMSCPAALVRDLRRDHATAPFDAMVVAHSYAMATALSTSDVPIVLDEHNIESDYQREYFAADRRVGARREVELLAAWERRAWSAATTVTCVSDRDASVVRAYRGGRVDVVPNGTDTDRIPFTLPSQRSGRNEVLFVGLMSHAPNVSAAVFLAREVMGRVWASRPDARLVLCGRSPAKAVRALAAPRVEVTGTVDSVVPYLARAAVFANALFHGAGSSLKVPEALASGLPLVSTRVGVRGFPIVDGAHYVAAETADEFAAVILAALAAPGDSDARALRALNVAREYDWNAIGRSFAKIVRATTSPATPPVRAKCPLCDVAATQRFERDGYAIHRCVACDFEFVHPTPPADAIARVYADGYFRGDGHGYRDYFASERAVTDEKARTRVDALLAAGAPRDGHWLDIGCADGRFLLEAVARGARVTGVEPSGEARGEAHPSLREEIFDSLSRAALRGPFDVVTLWDVLEHLPDPFATLEAVRATSARGAVIGIVVPIIDNVNARWAPRTWDQYKPPEHLSFFSRRSLRAVMDRVLDADVVFERSAWRRPARIADVGLRLRGGATRWLARADGAVMTALAHTGAFSPHAFDDAWLVIGRRRT